MKAGDIVFVRGSNPVSKIIQYFDGQFSHVGIMVSDKAILEIDFYTKIRIRPFPYKDIEVVDLKLTDEQRDKIVHLGVDLCGVKYDFLRIIGEIVERIFKHSNTWNNPKNMICSEVMVYLLLHIGWISADEIDEVLYATPNELYKFVINKLSNN